MNDTSVQPSPFVGHLIPGIAYFFFGLILLSWYINPPKSQHRISMGVVLVSVVLYAFIALMVDMFHLRDMSTKFHRVLTMSILPLAVTLLSEKDEFIKDKSMKLEDRRPMKWDIAMKSDDKPMKWEIAMMLYCVISTIMYMGHQHKEEPDGVETSMMMPSPEEQVCAF